MIDDFFPKISERPTEELLRILGSYEEWNPKAVELAKLELKKRNVSIEQIKFARYIELKENKIDKLKRAKEGFNFLDFVLPGAGLQWFIVLFSWELKKDGFLRKARQQKRIWIGLILFILLIIAIT